MLISTDSDQSDNLGIGDAPSGRFKQGLMV